MKTTTMRSLESWHQTIDKVSDGFDDAAVKAAHGLVSKFGGGDNTACTARDLGIELSNMLGSKRWMPIWSVIKAAMEVKP